MFYLGGLGFYPIYGENIHTKKNLEETATKAFVKLYKQLPAPWTNTKSFTTPHLQALHEQVELIHIDQFDDRFNTRTWTKGFYINLDSFDGQNKLIQPSGYTIYTDGSKTDVGTGAGFVAYHKKERIL